MADRQSQTHSPLLSPLLRGEIGIKDFRQHVLRHAATLVGNAHPDIFPCRQGRLFLGAQNHILRPDEDHSSLRHRLARIQDHVADDLSDLSRVHLRQTEILGQGEVTP